MAIAIALILLVIGSLLFHFLSPWNLTPLASNWGAIDNTVQITFLVTGIAFVLVIGFMIYCLFRYRYDENRRAGYEPESTSLELWLTGITTVGIAGLLAPGLFVWANFVDPPEEAHRFEVLGQQWHWSFRFPGADGELGRVHSHYMSEDNPFGIDPDDPAGQDDIIITDPIVYLPVDEPVRVFLRSRDVIHNFKVPNFRAKMDALPGQMSSFWFTPTELGDYQAVCAQLCGIAHFAMRATVRVVERQEFDTWLAQQPTFGELRSRGNSDVQAGEARYQACVACHGLEGQGNPDMDAPKLAGLSPWYVERQLRLFRDGGRGVHEADVTGQNMAPFARPLDDEAIRNIAAYIDTLPDQRAERTIIGNPERGRRLYSTCAHCHGASGEGNWSTHAPRLAGASDWYLTTQLENFRSGVRGRHAIDRYGNQMVDMAQYLVTERDIRDVVAYINTLPLQVGDERLPHGEHAATGGDSRP